MTRLGRLLFCFCICACGRTTLRGGEGRANDGNAGDPGLPDPKVCAVGPICAPFVNDPATGECIQVAAPDGTPCIAPACFADATCLAGQCVGRTPDNCDDNNACTNDMCLPTEGCVYSAVTCTPSPNLCRLAQCDPLDGCIERFAPDGSPCETNTCGGRNACRAGGCLPAGPTPTLVGAWNFDEPDGTLVFDSSGRGHTGTLVAGLRVPSSHGRGITPSASGLLVDVPDHPDFAFQGSFSVRAWIRTPSEPVLSQQDIVFRGDAREGLDPFVLALIPEGLARFTVEGSEGGFVVSPRTQVLAGAELELTGVFDAAAREARLYVRCELAASECSAFAEPLSVLDSTSAPGVGLGSHAGLAGILYGFRGILDEVRLYDGALDTDWIGSNCVLP